VTNTLSDEAGRGELVVHLEVLLGRPLAVLGEGGRVLRDARGGERLLVVPEHVGVGVVRRRVVLAVLLGRAEEAREEVVGLRLARVGLHQVGERHEHLRVDELADLVVADVEDVGRRAARQLGEQLGVVVAVAGHRLQFHRDVGVPLHELRVELLEPGEFLGGAPGRPHDRVLVGSTSPAAAGRKAHSHCARCADREQTSHR
jgi:hypothetical protein